MRMNSEIPASELTRKKMFKKMNFMQYDPNIVNIRRKGGIQVVETSLMSRVKPKQAPIDAAESSFSKRRGSQPVIKGVMDLKRGELGLAYTSNRTYYE